MATVAQRVNEMQFALRGMGVPAEVTDHLDLHAHADPELSSKENIDNFLDSHALEQYRLKGQSLKELRSLEEEAAEEGIDSEVQRRLDERIAEITAEVRAEGCAECNAQLRALEARLKLTAGGQAFKKRPRASRPVAKKARSAAQKRADRAASRRMKGTNPFGNRKGSRKGRRRSTTAKAKNGGRRRARGTFVTPKRIVKFVAVVDGIRRIVYADYTTIQWYMSNRPLSLKTLAEMAKDKQLKDKLGQPLIGVGEIFVAPKAIDKISSVLSHAEPMIGKLSNAKLLKIGA